MKRILWFFILLLLANALISQELYFEAPILLDRQSNFPTPLEIGGRIYLIYQEILPIDEESGIVQIKILQSNTGQSWTEILPGEIQIEYNNEISAQVYSAIARDGSVFVALTESSDTTAIYQLSNLRSNPRVSKLTAIINENSVVSPKLDLLPNGNFILFGSQSQEAQSAIELDRLSIVYSSSSDGRNWSNFQVLEDNTDFQINFNPSLAILGSRTYVVFQNQVRTTTFTNYQLYVKYSDDNGQSWSESALITNFFDLGNLAEPEEYDNQRPHLFSDGNSIYLSWERAPPNSTPQAYQAEINSIGMIEGSPEAISNSREGGNFPIGFTWEGNRYILYFTRRSGVSQVILEQFNGRRWEARTLNRGGEARFPQVLLADRIHFFWQQRASENQAIPNLIYLEPDQQVSNGTIITVNHQNGGRYNDGAASFRILPPSDTNGIAGYSVIWSKSSRPRVPEIQNLEFNQQNLLFEANSEGTWNLGVRVQDRAGNWSDPVYSSYILDLTPPSPVRFTELETDDEGFLTSNNFTIEWTRPPEEDFSSFQFRYTYLGVDPDLEQINVNEIANQDGVFYQQTNFSRFNEDDGTWLISVKPVDDVGNVGEVTSYLYSLNKYVDVTIVNFINRTYDELGNTQINIQGRGFTANGVIDEIIFDIDGQEPFDYRFRLEEGDYRLPSNRIISDLSLNRVSSGTYQVFLNHTDRGRYISPRNIELQDQGVIKFGNYEVQTQYEIANSFSGTSISVSWIVPVLLAILGVFIGILSINRLRVIIGDVAALKAEARALVEAKVSPVWEREQRIMAIRRQGISLRVKFTIFIVILVVSVVLVVSLPLSNYILTNQQQVLAKALEDRAELLMESISRGAAPLLENAQTETIALINLINQSQALEEAEYVTITGRVRREGDELFEPVWSTNDPLLLNTDQEQTKNTELEYYQRSIDGEYFPGKVSISDSLSSQIFELQETYDQSVLESVGTIPEDLDGFTNEIRSLIFDQTAAGAARRQEIDTIRRGLNQQLETILRDQTGGIQSIPEYNVENFDLSIPRYLFYSIVYFRLQQDEGPDQYYQGLVRIGISTDTIVEQINTTSETIRNNILIFAAIAIVAGILGAYVLASLTVIPIRKLVTGVELIRDTDKKQELKGHQIDIKTRDELNLLSDVINQMTKGLVKAAEDNQELMFGKDVQKMFIQLDAGDDGQKLSTGHTNNDDIDMFGYYEGAKGVSGDYYFYQKLDQHTYAIIKCDVAGKGIPAALIMVEVATLFLNHFTDWQKKQIQRKRIAHALKDTSKQEVLAELVYNINDLIAEREFKGKFAALNIALLNEKTGEITFCNAGDNQVNTYREKQAKVVLSTLNECPAAGVFNSKDMPISFIEEKDKLESGDILLMFTDGIEEAKRLFRDENWGYINATEEHRETGKISDDISVGMDGEEFTTARIHDIVNAVKDRGRYSLTKYLTPLPNENIDFDFSSLEGTSEDVVLALIAVEKIFRLVPDPASTIENKISIDKKVDDFLKTCFDQYQDYFHHPLEEDPTRPLYNRYSHIKEDDQYDDLTILAIRKK
jgi:hypothetical protein